MHPGVATPTSTSDEKPKPDASTPHPPRLFGRYLVEHEIIDEAALAEALELMKLVNRTVGQLATERGLVTAAQAERVATLQREIDGRWGEIAVAAGFGSLDAHHIEALLAEQTMGNLRLSDALVELGHMSASEVEVWWSRYEAERAGVDPLATLPEEYRSSVVVREVLQVLPRISVRTLGLSMRLGEARPWTGAGASDVAATIDLDGQQCLSFGILLHDSGPLSEDDVVHLVGTAAWHAARRLESTCATARLALEEPQRGVVPELGVAMDAAIGDATCTLVLAIRARDDARSRFH